jgi:hypothetical protein
LVAAVLVLVDSTAATGSSTGGQCSSNQQQSCSLKPHTDMRGPCVSPVESDGAKLAAGIIAVEQSAASIRSYGTRKLITKS